MSVVRRVAMRAGVFLPQPSVQVMMAARCVFAGPIKRLPPRVGFTQSRSWCSDGPVSDRNEVRLHWLDGEDNGRCINYIAARLQTRLAANTHTHTHTHTCVYILQAYL